MAFVCGSLCVENEVQLTKIVYMVALDEVNLIEINPFMNFVSQKIAPTFGAGSDTHQKIATTSSFIEDGG
jgi:hypothetical protein